VLAQLSGIRIVEMTNDDLTLSKILTRKAFINAIRVNAAIGGSTNAVIHLKAIAQRIGVDLNLEDWDTFGRDVPTIVDLQPSGRYLMEDFYYAGGLPAVLRQLGENGLLERDALTVNGHTIWDNVREAPCHNPEVIRGFNQALVASGGICILRGNLAPRGAVLKPSAATGTLMTHRGRAVVFDGIDDYHARIDDEALDIDETCIMVLKNCGPKGYPGMAEVGNMGLPAKLLRRGITDMVRISDARMSGTAFGTVVLHVAPEAMELGPLAIVENGDEIVLDAPKGLLRLEVSDDEIARRIERKRSSHAQPRTGGYLELYRNHVLQADEGCDFDFLIGCRGRDVPAHSH
jgi:dihydroxy-acid dehydratase